MLLYDVFLSYTFYTVVVVLKFALSTVELSLVENVIHLFFGGEEGAMLNEK